MLSPSKLFFGTPDPNLESDEKPDYCGTFAPIWPDSEEDEQTDVPAEQSIEASMNESEEERKSPGAHQQPTVGTGGASGSTSRVLRPTSGGGLPDRPPPGLPPGLPGSHSTVQPPPGDLGARLTSGQPASEDDDSDEEEDADDERSQLASTPGLPPADMGAVWYSELPSIGSANHFNGTCDRCCFHPKGRCLNGYNCQHCHFDHEKRKRKNKKKSKATKGCQLGDEAGDMSSMAADSCPVSPNGPFVNGLMSPNGHGMALSHSVPNDLSACGAGQPVGFPAQPAYFPGSPMPRSPQCHTAPGVAVGLAQAGDWYPQAAPVAPPPAVPLIPGTCPPPMSSPATASPMLPGAPTSAVSDGAVAFSTAPPPPGIDVFSCRLPGQLPGDGRQASQHGFGCELGIGNNTLPPALDLSGLSALPRLGGMEARYAAGDRPDVRDDYIRQLEAENRYLRAYILQYGGVASSGGLGTTQPLLGGCAPSLATQDNAVDAAAAGQLSCGPGHLSSPTSAGMPPMPLGVPPLQPPTPSGGQNLSASAAPWFPGNKVLMADLDATRAAGIPSVPPMPPPPPNHCAGIVGAVETG